MRLLCWTVAVAALAAPSAFAQSLHIEGVTGYLSEYALSADLSRESAEGGTEELSGPLDVKHVGLCSHSGPDETVGQLKIRFRDLSHRIEATLNYDGRECVYYGLLSKSAVGVMTCTNNLTLPIGLWTK